jgi:hypothetical protein
MVYKLLEAWNFRIEIHPAHFQYRDTVKWAWIDDCRTWWLFRTALAWLRGLIWVALVPRRQMLLRVLLVLVLRRLMIASWIFSMAEGA